MIGWIFPTAIAVVDVELIFMDGSPNWEINTKQPNTSKSRVVPPHLALAVGLRRRYKTRSEATESRKGQVQSRTGCDGCD